jgi:hypothetical protein
VPPLQRDRQSDVVTPVDTFLARRRGEVGQAMPSKFVKTAACFKNPGHTLIAKTDQPRF